MRSLSHHSMKAFASRVFTRVVKERTASAGARRRLRCSTGSRGTNPCAWARARAAIWTGASSACVSGAAGRMRSRAERPAGVGRVMLSLPLRGQLAGRHALDHLACEGVGIVEGLVEAVDLRGVQLLKGEAE